MKHVVLLIILTLNLIGFSQSELAKKVMKKLEPDSTEWYLRLITEKVVPTNRNESILVLPIYMEYEVDYFGLYTWLVRVDNRDGTIKNKTLLYYESDANVLEQFVIDTAPYQVNSKTRAFGLRVIYYGSSQPNPYRGEKLTLLVDEGDSFRSILDDFYVKFYGGEWITQCSGESMDENKLLILLKKSTQGYFDILVKNTIIDNVSFDGEFGECESTSKTRIEKTKLQFKDGKYQEVP